jgi:nucleoside-diphosphate-sugar epimerase
MKRIGISGCHGFIANYVASELKKRGYTVIGTAHHLGSLLSNDWDEMYITDVRDKAGMYSVIEHCDGFIHLAGLLGTSENMRQADLLNEVNIGGALNVLNACDNFGIPLAMIAVGNTQHLNPYSISKTTAERYALMYAKSFGTKVNVVRALNAFYPNQKWGKVRKIIPTFINQALRNEPLLVYGGKEGCSNMDMVTAHDVGVVLIEALENANVGVIGQMYEAGTGVAYPVYEIAEKIVKYCNSKSEIVEVPMRDGEFSDTIIAKNPYPIEYEDFDEALMKTIEYYKAEYEKKD